MPGEDWHRSVPGEYTGFMVERTRWVALLCLAACVACGNEAGLDLREAGAGGAPPAESGAPTTGGGGGESTGGAPSTGGALSTGGNPTWDDGGMCFKPIATSGNEPFSDCPCLDLENSVSGTACTNVGEVCRYDHNRRCWVRDCECRIEGSGNALWWCPTLLC
jgi:hypothetical protein